MFINIPMKHEIESYLQQHPETQKFILAVLEENPDVVEDLTHKIEVKFASLEIEDIAATKKNKWVRFAKDYSRDIEGLGDYDQKKQCRISRKLSCNI